MSSQEPDSGVHMSLSFLECYAILMGRYVGDIGEYSRKILGAKTIAHIKVQKRKPHTL